RPVRLLRKSAVTQVAKEEIAPEAAHREVRPAVVIVVAPVGHEGRLALRGNAPGGHPGERSVAKIAIEEIVAAVVRDKQVWQSVTVVVLPGRANGRAAVAHDPGGGDPRERPIAVVAQEHVVVSAPVRDEQVEPTITVVVAPTATPRSRPSRSRKCSDFGETTIAVVPIE